MIFLIILGAAIYNNFLVADPAAASRRRSGSGDAGLSPWVVLAVVLFMYLVFGCVMDSLSMILLTVPIIFPIMSCWISG